MKAIVVDSISKHYPQHLNALREVSFEVEQSELFGLIGPDGAGKTSLFRILTTVLLADNGNAQVDGFDVRADYKTIRKRVGYMPGRFSLYPDLSVEENLNFFAKVFHTTIEQNYDLVRDIYVQLEPFKNRRAGKLSGGMKQKLALCCALIHKPSVLFLDEPTTGVDPVSRREFWEMLKRLKAQNISILVSTPYMDEASLCDRIAFIQNGSILSVAEPKNIKDSFKNDLYAVKVKSMYEALLQLREADFCESCYAFGDAHHLTLTTEAAQKVGAAEIESFLTQRAHTNIQVTKIHAGIEDSFMSLSQGAEAQSQQHAAEQQLLKNTAEHKGAEL